jgi:microcystin-dependent protein
MGPCGSPVRIARPGLMRLAVASPTEPEDAVNRQTLDDEVENIMSELSRAIPTGTVLSFAGGATPEGFLLCYGQAVNRVTYSDLFAAIGTTYGAGDGSTTFNLPDWRGRTPIGLDNMGGVAANRITSASTNGANSTTLGGTGGAETHTLSTAQLAAHNHSMSAAGSSGNQSSISKANDTQTTFSTNNTGGGSAHSNTQPWITTNYIIKT